MRIVSLCLLALGSCSVNEAPKAASVAVGVDSELEECTEIVRGLLSHVEDIEARSTIRSIDCDARAKILTKRAESAEQRASRSEWLARWGAPLGVVAGVAGGSILTALLFVILGPQGR